MKIFGIDPGSQRTGYGCVETDGFRHRLVQCGAITSPALTPFPDRLLAIYQRLAALTVPTDDLDPAELAAHIAAEITTT